MTLQTLVDAREDLNIRAYDIWSSWQQQHALAEIEHRLQYERIEPLHFPTFWIVVAAIAIGGLLGLRLLQ